MFKNFHLLSDLSKFTQLYSTAWVKIMVTEMSDGSLLQTHETRDKLSSSGNNRNYELVAHADEMCSCSTHTHTHTHACTRSESHVSACCAMMRMCQDVCRGHVWGSDVHHVLLQLICSSTLNSQEMPSGHTQKVVKLIAGCFDREQVCADHLTEM